MLAPSPLIAQVADSTQSAFFVDSVVVRAHRHTSMVRKRAGGSVVWDMGKLQFLPQILGNADPLHYAQMLPGVQTNSEYQSGIHVQGCDNGHNMVSLGGVPIYNVSHLLGFFSVFNASHFRSLTLDKWPSSAAFPGVIGGLLRMDADTARARKAGGEVSVGLVSSQGTVHMPVSGRTAMTLSLRASYINALYGRWLMVDNSQLRYSFFDANLSLAHRLDERNTLLFDAYGGQDRGGFGERLYDADMKARWGNAMAALHWMHRGRGGADGSGGPWHMRHTLYATAYANRFTLSIPQMEGRLPSSVLDIGYKGQVCAGNWTLGAEVVTHHIQPQKPDVQGAYKVSSLDTGRQHSVETAAWAGYAWPLGSRWTLRGGLRAHVYGIKGHGEVSADPSLAVLYDDGHLVSASASVFQRHQHLFQVGFTDTGLPTEFWLSARRGMPSQVAQGAAASVTLSLCRRLYLVTADVYYRRLRRLVEYSGNVYDLVNTDYNLDNALLHGSGYNWGFSLMVQRCAGPLTGWCSYAFTRARRSFTAEGLDGSFPASHERPHECNVVLQWAPTRHLSLGVTGVYASGTPFTAPVSIGLVNGHIVARYGQRNAQRLSPYARIDCSATWKWGGRRVREQGVNLSVYNLTRHHNDLFYRIRTRSDGDYAYRPVRFIIDILPSLSYYVKF